MSRTQFAYTPPAATPAYFNITLLDDGKVRVTVRSQGDGNSTGPVASIEIDRATLASLLSEALPALEQP